MNVNTRKKFETGDWKDITCMHKTHQYNCFAPLLNITKITRVYNFNRVGVAQIYNYY